jgi:hypothetical protein
MKLVVDALTGETVEVEETAEELAELAVTPMPADRKK